MKVALFVFFSTYLRVPTARKSVVRHKNAKKNFHFLSNRKVCRSSWFLSKHFASATNKQTVPAKGFASEQIK